MDLWPPRLGPLAEDYGWILAKEYPDDHFAIGVTSMTAIFDFFDHLRK